MEGRFMRFLVDEMPTIPLCPFSKWREDYFSFEKMGEGDLRLKYKCTINKVNGMCNNNGKECLFLKEFEK